MTQECLGPHEAVSLLHFIELYLRDPEKGAKRLCKGAYGTIYGPYERETETEKYKFVMKEIEFGLNRSEKLANWRERYNRWPDLQHMNLVKVHEVNRIHSALYVAIEYASGGSLATCLKECQQDIPAIIMTDWAGQIASGMNYLHKRNIVHRDLKSLNVVIMEPFDERYECLSEKTLKITDFDSLKDTNKTISKSTTGTESWMAPEILKATDDTKFGTKSDVYSYGVVLWEMASRKLPFFNVSTCIYDAYAKVMKGKYEWPIPPTAPDGYRQLIEDCLQHKKEDRPEFDDILENLKGINQQTIPDFGQINLLDSIVGASCLDSGIFGKIKGPCEISNVRYVVKEVSSPSQQTFIDILKKIYDTWPTLAHKNVLKVHKVQYSRNSTIYVAMEYARGGSLRDYLDKSQEDISLDIIIGWAKQMANGTNYLHENNIVHGDLKSPSVVIMESFDDGKSLLRKTLKITDLDSFKDNDQSRTKSSSTLNHWTAPEDLKLATPNNVTLEFRKESNIYSYGVIVWELATKKRPFAGQNDREKICEVMRGEYKWPIPATLPEYLKLLIQDCLNYDMRKRPTFDEILGKLNNDEFDEIEGPAFPDVQQLEGSLPELSTNEKIKQRVRANYGRFITSVDPEHLADWLKQESVIAIYLWQKMRHDNPIAMDRCRALIDHLLSIEHPNAFVIIRNALKQENHFLLPDIDIDDSTNSESIVRTSNEYIKQKIQGIYTLFIKDVDARPLSDWLIQERVITTEFWNRISKENATRIEQCRALLDHLFTVNHPKAFEVVLKALENDRHYLAKQIRPTE